MGNDKKSVKHVGMKVKTFQQQDISKTVKKRTVNYRVERGRREVQMVTGEEGKKEDII